MAGAEWPVEFRGVTESVVATLGPNDRWNLAALGLHPPGDEGSVTARTFGRTRTRRNFERTGSGVVQFTRDPVVFVEAALSILERSDPVHESADAWVRVEVEPVDRSGGEETIGSSADEETIRSSADEETIGSDDVEVVEWTLDPVETVVERTAVPTINRGFNAVVEASVWASRLDVPGYETDELLDRLAYLSDAVEAAGTDRDREAFDRIDDLTEWRTDR